MLQKWEAIYKVNIKSDFSRDVEKEKWFAEDLILLAKVLQKHKQKYYN